MKLSNPPSQEVYLSQGKFAIQTNNVIQLSPIVAALSCSVVSVFVHPCDDASMIVRHIGRVIVSGRAPHLVIQTNREHKLVGIDATECLGYG